MMTNSPMPLSQQDTEQVFVEWFRASTPYINTFRGRTFVVSFGGELLAENRFSHLLHDLVLLHSLGVRLILVHGARPQIEERLQQRNHQMRCANGLRITDPTSLICVKEAIGTVRVELEAQLSMGLVNSPMAGANIRVVSGNFVTARPLGVLEGVDYQHTGTVRRIHGAAISQQLDHGAMLLLSPLGYSPTGEIFNLSAEEVATRTAITIGADKVIHLVDGPGLIDAQGQLIHQLTLEEAEHHLQQGQQQSPLLHRALRYSLEACRQGVQRAHLIDRHRNGALLAELFTRDGVGTLINTDPYDAVEQATIDDVGGILELITPLEEGGILVRRSRERLEMEINSFTLIKRDNSIIACAALYPDVTEQMGELACFAVNPDYRGRGRGDLLLTHMEERARRMGLASLFLLTTHTAHWFQERGYQPSSLEALPMTRQGLYNYQRQSKVFLKPI